MVSAVFSSLPSPSMVILELCLLCELTMKSSTFTDKTWYGTNGATHSASVQC